MTGWFWKEDHYVRGLEDHKFCEWCGSPMKGFRRGNITYDRKTGEAKESDIAYRWACSNGDQAYDLHDYVIIEKVG